jgi:23S rRNA pseudouridine1911/1915/1917 synthase
MVIYLNNMEKAKFTVPPGEKSWRLDSFLSSKTGLSRAFVQKLINSGMIAVNSEKKKPNYRLRTHDLIEMTTPSKPDEELTPEDIPLSVIWEDNDIVVIDKPPQMVVHPGAGNRKGTLINALLMRCNKLASIGAPLRPGVVHRLDKDTSGVIVIAKEDTAYISLQRQFKQREVEKQYLALLYGNPKKDQGEIKESIGRSVSNRKKMSTRTRKGREAVTRFEVIKRFKPAVLARIKTLTGRTHQIRVHCSSIGHPVLGDKLYGKKTELKFSGRTILISRQMLHAHSIKFRHPKDKKLTEFTAPVPEDMKNIIEELASL